MAEKDTSITDWKAYSEQATGAAATQNSPLGADNINDDGAGGAEPYDGIGNAFRDIKRVVKSEFQNLGWDASNTYVNTSTSTLWELIAFETNPDSLRPLNQIRINAVNLTSDPTTKPRWVTRGTKVFIIKGSTYYSGTVDDVSAPAGGTGDTSLICSNVRQHFIETNSQKVVSENKTYLNTPPDTTITNGSRTEDRPADYSSMPRGGFPNGIDGDTSTLYISTHRERMVPHDPDFQSYSSATLTPTTSAGVDAGGCAQLADPTKIGLINQISPYPSKALQGCLFLRDSNVRVAVPLQSRQPDNKYSLFFTPLENYVEWLCPYEDFDTNSMKERIEYTSGPKTCYNVVQVDKYEDRFVVEFSARVPLDTESGDVATGKVAAILWEWLLVRDFR